MNTRPCINRYKMPWNRVHSSHIVFVICTCNFFILQYFFRYPYHTMICNYCRDVLPVFEIFFFFLSTHYVTPHFPYFALLTLLVSCIPIIPFSLSKLVLFQDLIPHFHFLHSETSRIQQVQNVSTNHTSRYALCRIRVTALLDSKTLSTTCPEKSGR